MITLSEAYRKLNNKNTRRRVNEAVESDIPAQFRKYYKISDYEPSGGEYEVGDRVGEFEIAAYLEPKAQYDRIEIWPFLLKSKDGYMVAEVAWDRVYPVNIDEVTMYLDESTRRPTRRRSRRTVNEAMQSDIPAPFNKYFKISDYEPDEDDYQIGERVDDYEIAAYLEPKDQYEGHIEIYPFLLKGKEGFIVGDVSWDRVYYIDGDSFDEEATYNYREYITRRKNQGKNDKVGSLKYESRRRNTRSRRVNEDANSEYYDGKEYTIAHVRDVLLQAMERYALKKLNDERLVVDYDETPLMRKVFDDRCIRDNSEIMNKLMQIAHTLYLSAPSEPLQENFKRNRRR